jgi:hypothetical protein
MLQSFPINFLDIRFKLMFSFVSFQKITKCVKMSFVLTWIEIIYVILGHEMRNKSDVILLKATVFLRSHCYNLNNDNYIYREI